VTALVAGVDGCRAGWVCVLRQADPPFEAQAFLAKSFDEILRHPAAPSVIAIDIPIGFPERIAGAGRDCDCAVRRVLGRRASSVFAPPARAALRETDFRQACAAALAASDPPRQISKQMFHLFRKVCEVDGVMTPDLQARVFECHPEAAFWAMNGRAPLHEPKKLRGRIHAPGLEARRTLLAEQGFSKTFLEATHVPRKEGGPDDLLDACACSWTAARIHRGGAMRFPASPPLDAKGLRMEILA
jgi:predicted RNase H-like nuclease